MRNIAPFVFIAFACLMTLSCGKATEEPPHQPEPTPYFVIGKPGDYAAKAPTWIGKEFMSYPKENGLVLFCTYGRTVVPEHSADKVDINSLMLTMEARAWTKMSKHLFWKFELSPDDDRVRNSLIERELWEDGHGGIHRQFCTHATPRR